MAVIKRGILGGFQNKIANVVGSSWKGIATMRSLPISVANPRTAAQVTQRSAFSEVSKFASAILTTTIKPLWDRFAQQESGFNAFIRKNIGAWTGDVLADPYVIVVSQGTVAPSNITSLGADSSDKRISVAWNATPGGNSLPTDQAYVVVMNETTGDVKGFANVAPRSAGTWQANNVMEQPSGTSFVLWLAFRRADGSDVSNSEVSTGSVVA